MIVVDTHVIIWDALAPEKLSANARQAIQHANEEDGIAFCEISLWEIAMLMAKRKIQVPISFQELIKQVSASNHYRFQGITPLIAERSVTLPEEINPDPADRIIAATSIVQGWSLVTADRNLRQATFLSTIW